MILKHSFLYLIAEFIPIFLAIISISVYTRYLSVEDYALYSLVMTGVWLASAFFIKWLKVSMLRFWNMEKYKSILTKNIFSIFNITIITLTIITFTLVYFIGKSNDIPLAIILMGFILFFIQSLFDLNMAIKTSELEAKQYAFFNSIRAIGSISISIILVMLGFGAISIIVSLVISYSILTLVLSKNSWKYYNNISFNRPLTISLFTYGLPIAMISALEVVNNTIDRFLLVALDSLSASGIYSVAGNLVGSSLSILLYSLSIAAYPIVLKALEEGDKIKVEENLKKYASIFIGFSLAAVTGLIVISPNLLQLLIGPEFLEGSLEVFSWLAIAELFFAIQAFYLALSFQINKNTVQLMWIMLAVASINATLNVILIPMYGILGAAIATMSASFIGMLVTYYFGKKLYVLPVPTRDILKLIFSTIIMFLATKYLDDMRGWGWLLLQIILGASVYISIIFILNVSNIRNNVKELIQPKIIIFLRNRTSLAKYNKTHKNKIQ